MNLVRRSSFLIPLVVLFSALLGGFYGGRVTATAGPSYDTERDGLRRLTRLYSIIEENYADPVSPDKAIYHGAIPGMLRTLDPHSNFFHPHG